MGLILDTSLLIAAERRGDSIENFLIRTRASNGEVDIALSAISGVELTHGMYRARSVADRERRRRYIDRAFQILLVYPLTIEIAQLAGKIEGEQAAKGHVIPFEDLIIGATALHTGFDVATLNVRHFERIPDLKVVTL